MDPSHATSFGSVSSKKHSLPKKESSIHVHSMDTGTHISEQRLGKRKETLKQATPIAQVATTKCHVNQLEGKLNPCCTLTTQASHTKQRCSTKIECNKQNCTPPQDQIRKRCLTNMKITTADAISSQQHIIKRQITNTEQQNIATSNMHMQKSEPKQRCNDHMQCNQQQSGAANLHQLQSLKQQPTPSSKHSAQTSHSSHSLSSAPPKPSTILDLCTQRAGSIFEGDILAIYGPAKYNNPQNKAEILHVDLVDCKGQMTITMNISNTLVDTFLPRLSIGSSIRISNFTIKNKSQYERGDADCCIALTAKSTFETIPCVCTEHKLTPDFTISQLSEADYNYSVGSFGAIGTSYHLTKTHLEVHIKDGDLQEDMATVLIPTTYTELCATLQQLFSIADMPFILFKNIVRNGPQGTRLFRPSQSTFIEELNDQCTKAHLETLAKCNMQVVGVLKAKNAYFPPYEISCSACHHSLPFDTAIDMDSVHCTYCNADTKASCNHNIMCTLNTQQGNIDCSLQGDILKYTCPDIIDIAYEQYQQDISPMVFMLRSLHIYGTFTLAVNNTIIDIVKQ